MRDTPQDIRPRHLGGKFHPSDRGDDQQRHGGLGQGHRRATHRRGASARGARDRYRNNAWLPLGAVAAAPLPLTVEADAMHGGPMRRADSLVSCAEGTDEEAELKANAF